jgi:hypothetical protein
MLIGAATVVGGLSACGSSDSKQSTTVASKRAGVDVLFRVSNGTPDTLNIVLCASGSNCRRVSLGTGQSVTAQGATVNGQVGPSSAGDQPVEFTAESPAVGAPRITLLWQGDSRQVSLDEGEQTPTSLGGFDFVLRRETDTDFKEISLAVHQAS